MKYCYIIYIADCDCKNLVLVLAYLNIIYHEWEYWMCTKIYKRLAIHSRHKYGKEKLASFGVRVHLGLKTVVWLRGDFLFSLITTLLTIGWQKISHYHVNVPGTKSQSLGFSMNIVIFHLRWNGTLVEVRCILSRFSLLDNRVNNLAPNTRSGLLTTVLSYQKVPSNL